MTKKAAPKRVAPVPKGYRTVTPSLIVVPIWHSTSMHMPSVLKFCRASMATTV